MNKKIATVITLMVATLLVSSCGMQIVRGSGHVISETREVSGFSRITLAGMGDVILTQGDTESLKIEAENNLLGYIETEVRGDELVIGFKHTWENVIHPTEPIKYILTVKDLRGVVVSGAGNVKAEKIETSGLELKISGSGNIIVNTLSVSDLTVTISGSGNVSTGALAAETVSTTISGSGRCDIAGKVTDQNLRISGSGNYRAASLESQTAAVTVSGVGNSQLFVTESLEVHISGAGEVSYTGRPQVSQTIAGLGRVNHLDNP